MSAASMLGLASKSNARNDLSRGNPAARIRRSDRRRARSSHSASSSSATNARYDIWLAFGGTGDLAELLTNRGQPQHPTRLIDGRGRGLLGHAAPPRRTGSSHELVSSLGG